MAHQPDPVEVARARRSNRRQLLVILAVVVIFGGYAVWALIQQLVLS